MKRIALLIALISACLLTESAFAQKPMKIGYTSAEYIMYNHPKAREIESKLRDYTTQHEKVIDEKVKEFQEKYQAYEKGAAMMSEVQRADKERELQSLNARIEQLQKDAQADLNNKEIELTTPLLQEIQKAIDAVRIENGYTYILSTNASGASIILSGPEEFDISDLVFKKLGITPPAKTNN